MKKALRDSNLVFIHNRHFQKDLETVWKFQFFVWKTIQAWLGGKSSFLWQIPLIFVWKFTGFLLLKCSSSSCEQNFPKANYFRVYRKFATWRTFAKGPIYWSSVTVHFGNDCVTASSKRLFTHCRASIVTTILFNGLWKEANKTQFFTLFWKESSSLPIFLPSCKGCPIDR